MNQKANPNSCLATIQEAAAGQAGGKAKALALLTQAGVGRIPPFLAILPPAFETSKANEALPHQPSDDMTAEVLAALEQLGPGPYAVRSSALDEDGTEHSFAGQLSSFLNVSAQDIPSKVAQVWQSNLSETVMEYRRKHGLDHSQTPGVVIMPMIQPKAAGVAFSADPVSGNCETTIINAVAGLADNLVNGDETGQTYQVQGKAIQGESDLLSEQQIHHITALAQSCETHFGQPQDIEWAIDDEGLWLLQSRPITTLKPDFSHPDDTVTWWDNSNIVESYSGVTTPLTFSFAQRAYGAVYRRFLSLLGVSDEELRRNGSVLDSMIGLYRGRIYYNLSHWYMALALLPGFSINRRFMETMMGVAEGMPEGLQIQSTRGKFQDALHLIRTLLGLIRAHQRLPHDRTVFLKRVHKVLQTPDPPLAERSLAGLIEHYRELEAKLLHHWDAPLVNDFMAMIHYGVLKNMCVKWLDDQEGTLQNDLITATGGMVSAEPAERIAELAKMMPKNLLSIIETASVREIETAIPSNVLNAAHEYLTKFGERTNDELKLESQTLHDDPIPLWRAVARQMKHGHQEHQGEQKRDDAESAALQKLSPLQRPLFRYVLKHARNKVRDRENLRLERTRIFGRARSILRECGKRLAEAKVLQHAEDVFSLEVNEILGFVEGATTTLNFKELVMLRQQEFERFKAEPNPPRRFSTRGALHLANIQIAESSKPNTNEHTRHGIGCSPGQISGRVQVIHDPATVTITEPIIMVAERTDPGWILILPMARALIVERGSLLSHSAIVARELGIPAIVAVDGVTTWLKDGDQIEMDGQAGVVTKWGSQ